MVRKTPRHVWFFRLNFFFSRTIRTFFFLKLSRKVYYSEQSWWFGGGVGGWGVGVWGGGGGECHAVAATEHPRWWVCLCTPSALLLAAPD